ncbi:MAG: peptidoglycan-binding domain-containing protein, partial [Alphaproteobacteria bacterium]|nr:peptidoglycan-binding domain-containing protein [Alphaproteobacteria bacterium]
QTDGERELNQAAVKALEQELRTAEDRQRELDAALADAQDARIRGAAAEAERRRREEGQRPPPPPPPPPSPPTASAPAPAPAPPPPPLPAAATTNETMELAAWNAVAPSTNPAMFEAFLAQFPRGVFAPMARVRLDELKAQTSGEARRRAEAEAKRLAEEEARRKTEGEAEARRQAERDEAALRLGDRDRQRLQIALTSLGFNTAGTDGVLGPRSREMIAAWQKARSQPSTGFVTVLHQQMLLHEAAAALSKHDEEQKRVEEDRKKAEAEKARIQAQTPAPPPAPAPAPAPAPPPPKVEAKPRTEQALAAPPGGGSAGSTATPGYDGTYSGMVAYANGNAQALSIRVANGTGSGAVTNPRCGKVTIGLRIDANGNAVIRVEGYDGRCMSNLNSYASSVVNNQIKTSWSNPTGRTELTLIRQ